MEIGMEVLFAQNKVLFFLPAKQTHINHTTNTTITKCVCVIVCVLFMFLFMFSLRTVQNKTLFYVICNIGSYFFFGEKNNDINSLTYT